MIQKLRNNTFQNLHQHPLYRREYQKVLQEMTNVSERGDFYYIYKSDFAHEVGIMFKMKGLSVKVIGHNEIKIGW